MTTPTTYNPPVQLTRSNVSAIPLPDNHDTNWANYYGTWRLRRRLLDAMAKADTMGLNYSDLLISGQADYLDLVKAVRARISAATKAAALVRRKERMREKRAALT